MENKEFDEYIFVFSLDSLKIGLLLKDVHRAIRAVAVSPLPGAPSIVLGIINLGGKVIPIVNFRERFDLKDKPVTLSNKIIIVHSPNLQFGLVADDIIGLLNVKNEDYSNSGEIVPGACGIVEGVAIKDDEMILIHNTSQFLSAEEEIQLSKALEN